MEAVETLETSTTILTIMISVLLPGDEDLDMESVNWSGTVNGHPESAQELDSPWPGTSQRNSISILAEELDTELFEDYRKKVLQADVVEQLKQIQIEDPDSPGSPSLPMTLEYNEPIVPLYLSQASAKRRMANAAENSEKKNIMSSRHWGPIYVKVNEAGFLQLFYEKGLEKPFREFKLEGETQISANAACDSRREREQVIKLGTVDYMDFISFISTIQDVLFHLPATVDLRTMHQNYMRRR
ncbi:unnamed protein product [Ranitomeya imitator]|uniref:SHD domain-containing protein n=1 Tax=Ranitomeya imitator TaxID=111125 RepID=A0ABN9LNL0_9NEOB|nr:unnamed protein product [Ranitomeya imitator]